MMTCHDCGENLDSIAVPDACPRCGATRRDATVRPPTAVAIAAVYSPTVFVDPIHASPNDEFDYYNTVATLGAPTSNPATSLMVEVHPRDETVCLVAKCVTTNFSTLCTETSSVHSSTADQAVDRPQPDLYRLDPPTDRVPRAESAETNPSD